MAPLIFFGMVKNQLEILKILKICADISQYEASKYALKMWNIKKGVGALIHAARPLWLSPLIMWYLRPPLIIWGWE